MTTDIEIIEVGPRDGLQNQDVILSTAQKVSLIERLLEAGSRRIEVVSFVNPSLVPQMADAEAVLTALGSRVGLTRIGLVLNERGLDRALRTDVEEIGTVAVASDTFGIRNQKQTSDESVEVAMRVIRRAKESGRTAQVTIAAAFGCPYEGEVPVARVAEIARALAKSGPHEIALADTIGVATPVQVERTIAAMRQAVAGMPLRCHFHNTRGVGFANAWAALRSGVSRLDASVGGIGGCPFAPGATGNIASEDLIYMLNGSEYQTGYNLDRLIALAPWLAGALKVGQLPAMVSRVNSAVCQIRADSPGQR